MKALRSGRVSRRSRFRLPGPRRETVAGPAPTSAPKRPAEAADRRLDAADRPAWSVREFAGTFYVARGRAPTSPGRSSAASCSSWRTPSSTTYQAYYLLEQDRQRRGGGAVPDLPRHPPPGGGRSSSRPCVGAGSPTGRAGGRSSSSPPRIVYGLALFVVALATSFNGFLVGMAIGGLGFGLYLAVDLALVADVLPTRVSGKDLGVFNIAARCPSPSRRRSRRPFWRSAAGATACCTQSPECPPSSEPSPSCR